MLVSGVIDLRKMDEEEERLIFVLFHQLKGPGADLLVLHKPKFPDLRGGAHVVIGRAGDETILDAVFFDDFAFGLRARSRLNGLAGGLLVFFFFFCWGCAASSSRRVFLGGSISPQ